jgi:tetratricopeptide (TPR) repeat protein
MRRCLWLVSAVVLILVFLVGALVASGGEGKHQTSRREESEKEQLGQRRSHASKAILALLISRQQGRVPPDVDWSNAIAQVAQAIPKDTEEVRLHPQNSALLQERGLARCATGEWDAGIADITDAIRLAPENGKGEDCRVAAYGCRAFVRCALGEWDAGIADLTEAIYLEPGWARFYAMRSVAYTKRGKRGDAENALADRAHLIKEHGDRWTDEIRALAEILNAPCSSPLPVKIRE